jgi:hypothetical protein
MEVTERTYGGQDVGWDQRPTREQSAAYADGGRQGVGQGSEQGGMAPYEPDG